MESQPQRIVRCNGVNYRVLGIANKARANRKAPMVVYQDMATGWLFYCTQLDFDDHMFPTGEVNHGQGH